MIAVAAFLHVPESLAAYHVVQCPVREAQSSRGRYSRLHGMGWRSQRAKASGRVHESAYFAWSLVTCEFKFVCPILPYECELAAMSPTTQKKRGGLV